jgi:hypothetical protein
MERMDDGRMESPQSTAARQIRSGIRGVRPASTVPHPEEEEEDNIKSTGAKAEKRAMAQPARMSQP